MIDVFESGPIGWSKRLLEKKPAAVVLVLTALMIFRGGMNFFATDEYLSIAASFPTPTSTYQGPTILSPAIASVIGITTSRQWHLLHLIGLILVAATIAVLLRRAVPDTVGRIGAVAVMTMSGLAVTTMNKIGHYDIWMLTAAVLIGLSRSTGMAFLAGSIMGFTNFEQGLIVFVAYGLCNEALKAHPRIRPLYCLAGLLVAHAVVRIWYELNGVDLISRQSLVIDTLSRSSGAFLSQYPLQLFAWYSASWVFVLSICFGFRGLRRLTLISGTILLPGLAMIITQDGTRVFTATSGAVLLLLISWFFGTERPNVTANGGTRTTPELTDIRETYRDQRHPVTAMVVLIGLLTPGLMTWVLGEAQFPWITWT